MIINLITNFGNEFDRCCDKLERVKYAEVLGGTRILNYLMKTAFRELEPDSRDILFEKIYSKELFINFAWRGHVEGLSYLISFPYHDFLSDPSLVDNLILEAFLCNLMYRNDS